MATNQHQIFDIDLEELEAVRKQLSATPREVRKAYYRALSRTAVTIKKISMKMMKDKLQARSAKLLRRRLQQFKLKGSGKELGELRLWFGLDPVPVSSLKGKVKRIGSKKKPNGAIFTPSSSALSSQKINNGFVAKISKNKSIFTRTGNGKWDINEVKVDIEEALLSEIETTIFDQLPGIFFHHFETDLKGRIAIR